MWRNSVNFFHNSCLGLRWNVDNIAALTTCVLLSVHPDDDEVALIPLSTGSIAELYIQPMSSCVGDIDVMYHRCNEVAIPEGTAPPTHLPAEFDSRVTVFHILDSEFPGYVYLQLCYLLSECTDDGSYNAVRCPLQNVRLITRSGEQLQQQLHGPAFVTDLSLIRQELGLLSYSESFNTMDTVFCVRCLSWPSEASDWSARHRNYGWPDSVTVNRIVNNGCDVVPVEHRQCRQHEWMGLKQWRLSFSRAEVVLLNSWLPAQQIVYHMLRVFLKRQQLTQIRPTGDSGARMLSNYNLKTLMLWACELKPKSWWTDDMNVVRIGVKLLHILAVWLTDARCRHYFINNCNLLDHIDNSSSTTSCIQPIAMNLALVTETWLAEWFIHNYIRNCARLCPGSVLLLFDNATTRADLEEAMSHVICRKQTCLPFSSWECFERAHRAVTLTVSMNSMNMRVCLFWMRELAKLDRFLSHYFTAVAFLHVALKTTRPLEDELLDVLATICLQSNDLRRCRNARHSSALSLSQAATLMKVVANTSRSAVQLVEIELCKLYLHRALILKDSDSDSIYCLANVYLAVLYYTTGQYQTAIDHCMLVARSQDHLRCSSHVVQGELLPKIDNKIDNILGLSVFYQHVRTAALSPQQQTQHVSVFTTDFFAQYLRVRCLSITQCLHHLPDNGMQRFKMCFSELYEMFVTDVLTFKSLHGTTCAGHFRKLIFDEAETKPVTSGHLDTSELVKLLQQSAVEHLTTCRQLQAQKFGSELTIVTTDFKALYAYKCGEYQQCLQLSTDNVLTLISSRIPASKVFSYPEFIQLMDDDIVSLTGLTLLVSRGCRNHFEHVVVLQLTLSLYLMTQCQMKLRHSMTSLAQTLDYIEVTRRRPVCQIHTLDQLLLKLTERKILLSVNSD